MVYFIRIITQGIRSILRSIGTEGVVYSALRAPHSALRRGHGIVLILGGVVCLVPLLHWTYPSALPAPTVPPEAIRTSPAVQDLAIADSLYARGLSLEALARYRQAEQILAGEARIQGDDIAWLWLKIARTLLQADQPGAAEAALDTVLARAPASIWASVAYSEKGLLRQAAGRYTEAIGHYLKSMAENQGTAEGQLAFRLAYCYQQTKQWTHAVQWYDRARTMMPLIEDYCLFYSAQCLMMLKRDAEARERLNDLYRRYPHSLFYTAAGDYHFQSLIDDGRHEEAIEEARRRLNDDHLMKPEERAALLKHVARAHEKAARPDSARAIYRMLLEQYRATPAALHIIPAFIQVSRQKGLPLSGEEQLWIGQAYLEQGDYPSAFRYFQSLAAAPGDSMVTPRALYYMNRVRYLQKLYQTAENGFRQILARYPRHEVAPLAAFHIARCIRARKGSAASLSAYVGFAEAYPSNENAPDALFFVGEHLEDAGRYTEAAKHFHRIVTAYPAYGKRDDARWLAGYCYYRARRYDLAIQAFTQQAEEDSLSPYASKTMYWAGKAHEKADRRAEAVAAYRVVRERHPGSYYAYRAMLRLEDLDRQTVPSTLTGWRRAESSGVARPAPDLFDLVQRYERERLSGEADQDRPHLDRADVLFSAGLKQEGEMELEHFAAANAASPTALAQVVSLYYTHRHYREGIRAAGRLQTVLNARGRPDESPWPFLYPAPFWETVQKQAEALHLDPLFLLAVMRQESRFDHRIRSRVGAYGLMQLMPTTARALAKQYRLPGHSNDRLLEPEYNITLGSRYLAGLLRSYNGRPELALAAYNGGPTRVTRWIRERGVSDMDEFVEQIGITETRLFVKAVMNNYAQYVTQFQEYAALAEQAQ